MTTLIEFAHQTPSGQGLRDKSRQRTSSAKCQLARLQVDLPRPQRLQAHLLAIATVWNLRKAVRTQGRTCGSHHPQRVLANQQLIIRLELQRLGPRTAGGEARDVLVQVIFAGLPAGRGEAGDGGGRRALEPCEVLCWHADGDGASHDEGFELGEELLHLAVGCVLRRRRLVRLIPAAKQARVASDVALKAAFFCRVRLQMIVAETIKRNLSLNET